MGNVNSQGLTWLEWLAAAGIRPKGNGICAKPWFDLRQSWKAGVDPVEYRNDQCVETGLGCMQGRKGL